MQDAQGQAISGATAEAVAHYIQAARAFNLGYGDAPALFDAAREASPDFVMAHVTKAWMFALANDPSVLVHARSLVETAARLSMNERERGHVAALQQVLAGARGAAVSTLDALLMRYPFDLVAHQAATLLDGYLGTLSLGARSFGARFAVLVKGLAGLRRHARVPWLRP